MMNDILSRLAKQMTMSLPALGVQAVCIGIVVLVSYIAWRKKKNLARKNAVWEPDINGGKIVFEEEIGRWPPVVYWPTGRYFIYVPYHPLISSSRDNEEVGKTIKVTFVVLTILLFFFSMPASILTIIACIGIMRKWPKSKSRHPMLYMDSSGIEWLPPTGGSTVKVSLNNFKMLVQVPHRLANAEARQHERIIKQQALDRENALRRVSTAEQKYQDNRQDALRKLSTQPKRNFGANSESLPMRMHSTHVADPVPPDPIYQIASELIVITGVADQIWKVLAEFNDDEQGERANGVYHAIQFVRNHILREAATQQGATDAIDAPQQAVAYLERPVSSQDGHEVEAFE